MSSITIRYSKAGIMQYAYFKTDERHSVILTNDFTCRYVKSNELGFPKFRVGTKVSNVLKKIATFSYDKKAEIWEKDGDLFGIEDCHDSYLDEINNILSNYFYDKIVPLLPQDYVIEFGSVKINGSHLDDIEELSAVYYKANKLAYNILYALNMTEYDNFKPEVRWQQDHLNKLTRYLNV